MRFVFYLYIYAIYNVLIRYTNNIKLYMWHYVYTVPKSLSVCVTPPGFLRTWQPRWRLHCAMQPRSGKLREAPHGGPRPEPRYLLSPPATSLLRGSSGRHHATGCHWASLWSSRSCCRRIQQEFETCGGHVHEVQPWQNYIWNVNLKLDPCRPSAGNLT